MIKKYLYKIFYPILKKEINESEKRIKKEIEYVGRCNTCFSLIRDGQGRIEYMDRFFCSDKCQIKLKVLL